MKIGAKGELVIEGQTEARLAAHYLIGVKCHDRLDKFQPPLPHKKMGYLAFVGSRIEDLFGTSDTTEYRADNPQATELVAQMLWVAAMPDLPFARPPRLGRRSYFLRHLSALATGPITRLGD